MHKFVCIKCGYKSDYVLCNHRFLNGDDCFVEYGAVCMSCDFVYPHGLTEADTGRLYQLTLNAFDNKFYIIKTMARDIIEYISEYGFLEIEEMIKKVDENNLCTLGGLKASSHLNYMADAVLGASKCRDIFDEEGVMLFLFLTMLRISVLECKS